VFGTNRQEIRSDAMVEAYVGETPPGQQEALDLSVQ